MAKVPPIVARVPIAEDDSRLVTDEWYKWFQSLAAVVDSGGGNGGGGGIGGAHAPTHQPGGVDPMQVDAVPATGSLRTLGSGPNQSAPGNDPRFTDARPPLPHAPTHSQGGTDPVDVKNLAGYPGGTTTFLRADRTFATPPTGGGAGGGMEYLGDFVSGPTYNDGDIVVAADGIAYVCTVDGTTTPPEPWPGIGVPINATVDATYWTVSPHSTLVNERALNSLANGYVKSTFGEPSTVAVIPVSEGGTGAIEPVQARVNLGVGNVGTLYLNNNANTYLNGQGQWVQPIPPQLVAIFFTACPPGWARVTTWDGYFLRGNATYTGVGVAANNHYHEAGTGLVVASHTHDPGTLVGVGHTHDQGTLTAGSHTHTVSGLTLPSHNHGGIVGIDGRTDNDGEHAHGYGVHSTTAIGSNSAGGMDVDAGGSGNMARHPHNHNLDFESTTNNAGLHSHHLAIAGGIPSDGGQALSGTISPATAGVTGSTGSTNVGIMGATAASAPAVTGTTYWATNTSHPAYFDVVYCYKL